MGQRMHDVREAGPGAPGQRRRRLRCGRDRRGREAIAYAILAIPFSLLVFAILESCISFAGQQLLANATDNVARQLRTGQLKAGSVTEASLKKLICDDIGILVASGCPELVVD